MIFFVSEGSWTVFGVLCMKSKLPGIPGIELFTSITSFSIRTYPMIDQIVVPLYALNIAEAVFTQVIFLDYPIRGWYTSNSKKRLGMKNGFNSYH